MRENGLNAKLNLIAQCEDEMRSSYCVYDGAYLGMYATFAYRVWKLRIGVGFGVISAVWRGQ